MRLSSHDKYCTNIQAITLKEQLIQEIEQIPDTLLSELLDFLLFIKQRHIEEEITEEEKANMISSKIAYQESDYLTLDEYEASRG